MLPGDIANMFASTQWVKTAGHCSIAFEMSSGVVSPSPFTVRTSVLPSLEPSLARPQERAHPQDRSHQMATYQKGKFWWYSRASHAQRSSERVVFAFVELAGNDVDADGVILQTHQGNDNGPLPGAGDPVLQTWIHLPVRMKLWIAWQWFGIVSTPCRLWVWSRVWHWAGGRRSRHRLGIVSSQNARLRAEPVILLKLNVIHLG